MVNKITKDLEKTNKRLDGIKIVSIEDIEQKLTKQVKKTKIEKVFNMFCFYLFFSLKKDFKKCSTNKRLSMIMKNILWFYKSMNFII